MNIKKKLIIFAILSTVAYANEYTVKKGDTLYSIAKSNNISLDELKNINNKSNNLIRIGEILKVTVEEIYRVKKGDTLYSISKKHGITVTELKKKNKLNSDNIIVGQKLTIIGTHTKQVPIKKENDFNPIWPMEWNGATSEWGYRTDPITGEKKVKHTGIDLRATIGTPVYAPADGTVTYAGWMNGYGNTVIIDHGAGYTTLYGHLDSIKVQVKERVKQKTLIAKSGNTGRSTGPHLHYEIRFNGKYLNPLEFR